MAVYHLLAAIFSVTTLLAAVKGQRGSPGSPPQCSDGKVYKSCGTACPRTCDNLGELIVCTRQCVIGCFCPSGTVENGDNGCIEPSDCPGQTPVSPSTTSVTQFEKTTTLLSTTTISEVTTNPSRLNTNTQTKLGIIAGASAAGGAAVVLVILILVGLLIVILVRNANSRLEKSQGSSKPTVDSGAILDTRKGVEKNLIPVEMNAAYEVTTQENVAYIAAVKSSAYDYEDYVYNYI